MLLSRLDAYAFDEVVSHAGPLAADEWFRVALTGLETPEAVARFSRFWRMTATERGWPVAVARLPAHMAQGEHQVLQRARRTVAALTAFCLVLVVALTVVLINR